MVNPICISIPCYPLPSVVLRPNYHYEFVVLDCFVCYFDIDFHHHRRLLLIQNLMNCLFHVWMKHYRILIVRIHYIDLSILDCLLNIPSTPIFLLLTISVVNFLHIEQSFSKNSRTEIYIRIS